MIINYRIINYRNWRSMHERYFTRPFIRGLFIPKFIIPRIREERKIWSFSNNRIINRCLLYIFNTNFLKNFL